MPDTGHEQVWRRFPPNPFRIKTQKPHESSVNEWLVSAGKYMYQDRQRQCSSIRLTRLVPAYEEQPVYPPA